MYTYTYIHNTYSVQSFHVIMRFLPGDPYQTSHVVMGRRKKKPFINKKEAQTYRLVPRSQQDPLAGDVDESQYVLKPENTQVAMLIMRANGVITPELPDYSHS